MRVGRFVSVFLLLLGYFFSQSLHAEQNPNSSTTVKGKIHKSYLGSVDSVYLVGVIDPLNFLDQDLDAAAVDSMGKFELQCHIDHIQRVYLEAGPAKGELIIMPGKIYEISLLALDENMLKAPGVLHAVPIEFLNSGKSELNYLMADFQSRFELMLEDYQGSLASKDAQVIAKIDTLEDLFRKKYRNYNSDYLDRHVHFTFAALKEKLTLSKRWTVFEKYLQHETIDIHHADYMDFFHQYYSQTASGFMGSAPVQVLINTTQSFNKLMVYFKQSRTLQNDTLREMVVLKSLAEYKQFPEIRRNAVLAILDSASTQASTEQMRNAAIRLKNKLTTMEAGFTPPSFAFKKIKDDMAVSLNDYRGKYLYLQFWATYSKTSLQELLLLPQQHKSYGSRIRFISVAVDKEVEDVKAFLENYPKFNWEFLYCSNFRSLRKLMKVATLPYYALIDPDGKVVSYPCGNPADMETEFYKIKKKR